MNQVEARRVQKLGASSLIVTLPKEWVRDLDIKPGDIVYLKREGPTIRLIPQSTGRLERIPSVYVRERSDLEIIGTLVNCVYLTGLNGARLIVENPELKPIAGLEVKKQALNLLGVEVYEDGEEAVQIRVLIDIDQSKARIMVKSLISDIVRTLRILRSLVSREMKSIHKEELELIRKEIMRYEHAILRSLSGPTSTASSIVSGNMYGTTCLAVASSYVLFIIINIIENIENMNDNIEVDSSLAGIIDELIDAYVLIGSFLDNPSKTNLINIKNLLEKINNMFADTDMNSLNAQSAIIYTLLRSLYLATIVTFRALSCILLFSPVMSR